MTKIYATALIPICLIKKKYKYTSFIILILSSIAILYWIDFFELLKYYNKSGLRLSFSSALFFKIINFIFELNLSYKLFSVTILILLIIISLFLNVKIPKSNEQNEILFLIGSSLIVSGFFLNEGFIYKLIYLVFTFPLFFNFRSKISNLKFYSLIFILFYSIWAEFFLSIIEIIFQINYISLKNNPSLNFESIIFGIVITFNNLIYWMLNTIIIFISSKIFIKNKYYLT